MNTIPFKARTEILFVEVPKEANDFTISSFDNWLCCWNNGALIYHPTLPSGTWQILNLSNSLSESDMELVCESKKYECVNPEPEDENDFVAYRNYTEQSESDWLTNTVGTDYCISISESYASLLQHLKIDEKKSYLVIVKKD